MYTLTKINVQGQTEDVFEIYEDDEGIATVGYVYDEKLAIIIENALKAQSKSQSTENKISDYTILSGVSPQDLELKVQDAIKRRWQPYGNLFVTQHAYHQVMVGFKNKS